MGGSAEGITSGLQPRKKFAFAGTVDAMKNNENTPKADAGMSIMEKLQSQKSIIDTLSPRQPRTDTSMRDFLINFGLDIASRSPQGNIFQTAALAAQDPYEKFSKARDAEQNLLRQVGMEAEIMDINKETAAAAAAAKEAGAMSRLEKQIQADKDLYELEKGENLNSLITARAQESIADGKFNNYNAATNEAEWTFRGSKEYKDKVIGGVLSEKQSNDAKSQAKFAKSQGKKNGVGKIYYDPYKDQVLEVAVVEGDYVLRPVGGGEEVMDTIKEVVEKKETNPSYMRPAKPDIITPKIKDFMGSVEEQEGEFGTGA